MTFEYTTIENGVLEVHSRTEAFSCDDLPYGPQSGSNLFPESTSY